MCVCARAFVGIPKHAAADALIVVSSTAAAHAQPRHGHLRSTRQIYEHLIGRARQCRQVCWHRGRLCSHPQQGLFFNVSTCRSRDVCGGTVSVIPRGGIITGIHHNIPGA